MIVKFKILSSLLLNLITKISPLFLVISLTSCANNVNFLKDINHSSPENSKKVKAPFLDPTMPLPNNALINIEKSLILGDGEGWAGRIEIDAPESIDKTTVFFNDTYPLSGWTLISSTKSKTSILVFVNQTKSATIEIMETHLFDNESTVILTVAPRSSVAIDPKK